MTEINIPELREKIVRATPAPWKVTKREPYFGYLIEGNKEKIQLWRPDDEYYNPGARIDAELIVAAVNNLAALIAEVENARKLKSIVTALLEYCEHNTLNFQREKLEDYLVEIDTVLTLGKDEDDTRRN